MSRFDMTWRQLKDHKPASVSHLAEGVSRAASVLEERRKQALDYLGSDHVLHSEYQQRARHSPIADIWAPHRFLFDVEIKASVAGRI